MTSYKVTKFSISEIENFTIRCKKCGAGHIVKINSDRFSVNVCPSCGEPYGKMAADVFECLQQTCEYSKIASGNFDIEFDIVEK